MRQPVWIVNSALAVLLLLAVVIVLLTRTKPPRLASIEPSGYEKPIKKQVPETVIAKIYENDLFGTYQKPIIATPQEKPIVAPLPAPPSTIQTVMPQIPQPHFLEPLQLTVKGMILAGDDQKNRALIEQNKTKQETLYKIGDRIEDAQLLRIFKNRVVFIRSNGQEETLYLREREAKDSPFAPRTERWDGVIKKLANTEFVVDPSAFIAHIPSLASLISELDMLTVYRKGKPVGVRIGHIEADSVGPQLGLQAGDIITKINNEPVADLSQRLAIYQKVISQPVGSSVTVTLSRYKRPLTMTYKLESFGKKTTFEAKANQLQPTEEDILAEKMQEMHKRHTFAPSLSEIRKQEKRVILEKVKRKDRVEAVKNRPINQEI